MTRTAVANDLVVVHAYPFGEPRRDPGVAIGYGWSAWHEMAERSGRSASRDGAIAV